MSTERKYLALHDELTSVRNSEIVIKKKQVEETTLGGMALGSTVCLDENATEGSYTWVEYIVVEKRESAVAIFRKTSLGSYSNSSTYKDGNIDTYLCNGFMDRFKNTVKNLFVAQDIKYVNNSDPIMLKIISRQAFLLSGYEMGGVLSRGFQDGETIWSSYINHPYDWEWTRSPYDISGCTIYWDRGSMSYTWTSSSYPIIRPAIWVSTNAIVDTTDGNKIQASIPYESTELDTVRVDDKKYKLKDIDARNSSNITYDNTTSGLEATNVQSATDELSEKIENLQSGKEDASNKVISLSAQSTDTQFPSAKCVYDELNKEYELIEEITLTEDVTEIIRSQDTQGNAYDLKKTLVFITLPTGESSIQTGVLWVGFIKNNSDTMWNCYFGSSTLDSVVTYIIAVQDVSNGFFEVPTTFSGKKYQYSQNSGITYPYLNDTPFGGSVNKVRIAATKIPSGTNIKIYAIRN